MNSTLTSGKNRSCWRNRFLFHWISGIFICTKTSLMNAQTQHKIVKWLKAQSSKLWDTLIFWPAYTVNFSLWGNPQSLLFSTSQISGGNNWEEAFRISFQRHLLEVTFDLEGTVKAALKILQNYIIFRELLQLT